MQILPTGSGTVFVWFKLEIHANTKIYTIYYFKYYTRYVYIVFDKYVYVFIVLKLNQYSGGVLKIFLYNALQHVPSSSSCELRM